MPRDLQRTRPNADIDTDLSGLDEFKSDNKAENRRERITKEVPDNNAISPGWTIDKKPPRSNSSVERFTVPDDGEEVLIKFLDEKPFAPIFQHWLLIEGGQRRAFTCLGADPETGKSLCPLCDHGDKPKSSDWLNVVVLGDTPSLKVWYASADPAAAIKDRAATKRTSPLNKDGQYFAVSKKKGKNGFNSYSVDPVKEEELKEDWGINPLTETQIAEFSKNGYGPELVKIQTRVELQEIARKYLDE